MSTRLETALPALREGRAIRRATWPETCIVVVRPGGRFPVQNADNAKTLRVKQGEQVAYGNGLMRREAGVWYPWLPGHEDLLVAHDWLVVAEDEPED